MDLNTIPTADADEDMEPILNYLPEKNNFCAICLVTPNEARLIPNADEEFFQTLQPVCRVSPWLCTWCWGQLSSFRSLRRKAARSQQLLRQITTCCLTEENKKSLLVELGFIKSSRYSTHVADVINMSTEPTQQVRIKLEPLDEQFDEEQLEEAVQPGVACRDAYSDVSKKEENAINVIEIEIKQECNMDTIDDPSLQDAISSINRPESGLFSQIKEKFASKKPVSKPSFQRKKETKTKRTYLKGFSSDLLPHIIKPVELSEEEMRRDHSNKLLKTVYIKALHKCGRCALKFQTKDAYDKHMELHSPARGDLLCDICGRHDASPFCHRRHVRQHYRRVGCRLCSYTTRFRKLVICHYISAHMESQFQCLYCNKNYTHKPLELEEHVKVEHGVRMENKCNCCNFAFWVPDLMECHLRANRRRGPSGELLSRSGAAASAHAPRGDNCCGICGKVYKDKSMLTLHLNRFHNVDSWKFECDHCGRKFFSKYDMTIHIRGMHMGDGPQCPHCFERFPNNSQRLRHVAKVHLQVQQAKDKICEICGRGFSKRDQLRDHKLVHTGERPHVCSTCGKTFRQTSSLANHVKHVHLKLERRPRERPSRGSGFVYPRNDAGEIYCAPCDKTFSHKLAFSNHYKAHQRKNQLISWTHESRELASMSPDTWPEPE